MLSTTSRAGDCCVLAASCQTAGVLLADTGLIDSLSHRAIKELIGEKIGSIESEHLEEIDRNKQGCVEVTNYINCRYCNKVVFCVLVFEKKNVILFLLKYF